MKAVPKILLIKFKKSFMDKCSFSEFFIKLQSQILKEIINFYDLIRKKSQTSSCRLFIHKSLLNQVLQYLFLSSTCKCYNTEFHHRSAV